MFLPLRSLQVPIEKHFKIFLAISMITPLLVLFGKTRIKAASDSGIFLYIGQMILDGYQPYLHAWDHKGPFIFYINALAAWLTPESTTGIMVIQLLGFLVIMACLFATARAHYGVFGALFACALFPFLGLVPMETGNTVEYYGILFQSLTLYAFFAYVCSPQKWWLPLLVGITIAAPFMIRQNMVGIGAALLLTVPFLLHRHWKNTIRFIVFSGIGFVFVLSFFGWLAYTKGYLQEGLDGFIFANFTYIGAIDSVSLIGKTFSALTSTVRNIHVGILIPLLILIFYKKLHFSPFTLFVLTWLGVETLLTSISGKSYSHYFYMLVFPLCLCSAFIVQQLSTKHIEKNIVCGIFVALLLLNGVQCVVGTIKGIARQTTPDPYFALKDELRGKTVYVHSSVAGKFLYYTHSRCPTRFFTQFHLWNRSLWTWTESTPSKTHTQLFIEEMQNNLPEYIILDEMLPTAHSYEYIHQLITDSYTFTKQIEELKLYRKKQPNKLMCMLRVLHGNSLSVRKYS